MSEDVNIYEEIVKLNMRISCQNALIEAIVGLNPNLDVPTAEEMNKIYGRVIQNIVEDLETE